MNKPKPTQAALVAKRQRHETDLILRRISKLLPEPLARTLLPAETQIERLDWHETQFAARQRRLDRVLLVRTSQGERILHWEFMTHYPPDLGRRVYEYHVMLALSLFSEYKPGEHIPGIESMVILLGGRSAPPYPLVEAVRTSPLDCEFSGVHYRLEPVFLRTVDELLARDNLFWLTFAPLSVDATPRRMEMVLDRLRQLADEATYEEVVAGMVGLAQWDERRRGLDKPIWLMLRDRGEVDADMEHMFYKYGFRVGKRAGKKEGKEEGKREGKALWLGKGIEQGIEQGRLAAMKDNLKKVLQKRGFMLSSEQEIQIDICSDVSVLDRWFEKALAARSLSSIFGQGAGARRSRKSD